ncbi:hypothetical protein E6C27_scaffold133G001930 [Cucumis melo var. makuwa]|uniref:Uncharacterized protein n=1 Tax=Cucumis melo var. makuwa TaxID=1194695 RepID=A0A5A7TWN4_CUCMM|nr:hypothetical protein E6C27_scaffold133G001930 [Cucumis melo var. makuwa]
MLSKSQGITGFSSFSEGRDVERFCRNYYGNGKPNPDVKGSKWEAKGQRLIKYWYDVSGVCGTNWLSFGIIASSEGGFGLQGCEGS